MKSKFIGFRISEINYNKIQSKAKKANLNISQYVSLSALDKDIFMFDDIKEMNRQLAKMGNNLNQLTLLAHQGRIKEVDLSKNSEELSKILDKLCELIEGR